MSSLHKQWQFNLISSINSSIKPFQIHLICINMFIIFLCSVISFILTNLLRKWQKIEFIQMYWKYWLLKIMNETINSVIEFSSHKAVGWVGKWFKKLKRSRNLYYIDKVMARYKCWKTVLLTKVKFFRVLKVNIM